MHNKGVDSDNIETLELQEAASQKSRATPAPKPRRLVSPTWDLLL